MGFYEKYFGGFSAKMKSKYNIPKQFMGIPVEGAIERLSKKQDPAPQPVIQLPHDNMEGFIYVPATNLYVARERAYHNLKWDQAHEELQKNSQRMLTIPEFIEFLKYIKSDKQFNDIYKDITEKRDPWRSEWLDAYFEQRDDGMYVLTKNKFNSQKLEQCLMEDKTPGIDIESWLKNPTSQGLPNKKIKKGNLYYWYPRNGAVARFDAGSDWAYFDCLRYPSNSYASLGVRPCAEGTAPKN